VLPDRLQEAFGRGVPVLAQDGNHARPHAPLGIETGQDRRHLGIVFALKGLHCQALDGAGRGNGAGEDGRWKMGDGGWQMTDGKDEAPRAWVRQD
jgi:hypothetical protein